MESREPTSAPDSAVGAEGGALVFMSDASAEADRLSAALRARGYSVVDVPLGLLAGRAAVQRPSAVVCDANAPGTLETVRRMQTAAGEPRIALLLLSSPDEAGPESAVELEREASSTFTRPVDADELVKKVEELVGPPSFGSSPSSAGRPPVLVAAARRPYRYEGARRAARPLNQGQAPSTHPPPPTESGPSSAAPRKPSSAPPPRGASLVPAVSAVPHARLSPELEQLLGRAEQRVRQAPVITAPTERLSPEAEVEAVLPADLLAALDEPLEIDDADDAEDSAAGTAGGSEGGRSTRSTTSDGAAATAAAARAQRRDAVTGPGKELAEAPADLENDDIVFAEEPATAAPLRPSQLPPQSLRTRTTLEPPASVESTAHQEPPHELVPERSATEPPASEQVFHTTRPPRAEPVITSAEASRPELPPPSSKALEVASGSKAERPLPDVPVTLRGGDAFRGLARAVAARFAGAIAFEDATGIRRVAFRDGDFVTASSSAESEALTAFLAERGDLAGDVAQRVARKIPPFGRHAGAALIAQGHLRQDELWGVLRSHAEWLIGRVASMQSGAASLELELPARLQAEPGVFGGATGAEVLVEVARRVKSPVDALAMLGGRAQRFAAGSAQGLLAECALAERELDVLRSAAGASVGEVLARVPSDDFACVLWTAVELGILKLEGAPEPLLRQPSPPAASDPFDAKALRERIAARRGLVEEGDYFALLGVGRAATSYDVRRAYLDAKKAFDPVRLLTAETIDLKDDLEAIQEVLDEAYEILSDPLRRERYRRALDAVPV